jgi:hypothetical protein
MNNILKWIENWYKSQCDEDWEHSYGIKIETIDNPGWLLHIDLIKTSLESDNLDISITKKNENDWYWWKVVNNVFIAAGDPNKLTVLLGLFKKFVEEKSRD